MYVQEMIDAAIPLISFKMKYALYYVGLNFNNETNEIGLLEYFNTSGWVPICFSEAFDEHAADVTCRQLGYPFATNFSSVALPYDRPGIGITASFCEGASSGYLFSCALSMDMTCQTQLHLTCYNSKRINFIINIIMNGTSF